MSFDAATVKHALNTRWKVYDPSSSGYNGPFAEDVCILTEDDKEVVGCSEWMRCEREVFDYIVALHNEQLKGRK